MPTIQITPDTVILNSDGVVLTVSREMHPRSYEAAREAAMRADYETIERLALFPIPEDMHISEMWDEVNDAEEEPALSFTNPEDVIAYVRDMIDEGAITAGMLGIEEAEGHEHDLSNWNGSPIFYPTAEMAIEQAEASYGFWDYHDFGGDAPNGYRHATVPKGVGPYAPEGYDWVCLRRTDKGL